MLIILANNLILVSNVVYDASKDAQGIIKSFEPIKEWIFSLIEKIQGENTLKDATLFGVLPLLIILIIIIYIIIKIIKRGKKIKELNI